VQINSSVPEAPRAVLWDMDGTLLDSKDYHWQAWQATMAMEGRVLAYEDFISTFGQRNETILKGWLGPDYTEPEMVRFSNVKEERYRQLVRTGGVELLPGVQCWLTRLRGQGWRQAIASSAPLLNIQAILETLDIGGCFDAIVSSEDVQRGKPDPQVFLVAASKVSVPPEHCIVVEDAPAGVEGAHRAGMRAIGVRSSHAALPADWVVHTLDELPSDAFERLLHQPIARG